MPRRKKSIIEVDGQQYEAKYIGKGQYSKVYQVGDRVVMYTRGDCAKEVLAMFQYDRMVHLPELIRHENVTIRPGIVWYVFSSPYYRNVTTKDKSAYRLYKALKLYHKEWWDIEYPKMTRRTMEGIYRMESFVNYLRNVNDKHITNSAIQALQELVDVSSNCGGQVDFDIEKRNFGVNEYGTLIFRDLVFVRE